MANNKPKSLFDKVFSIFLGKQRTTIERNADVVGMTNPVQESELGFSPQTIEGILDDTFINKLQSEPYGIDSRKADLIKDRCHRIIEMKSQIKKIMADTTLSAAEKKAKINRRIEIIHNDEFSIVLALDFIKQKYETYYKITKIDQKAK